MKDARTYERKIKKLLSGIKKKARKDTSPPVGEDIIRCMIDSVFLAETTAAGAGHAVDALHKEFVDYNELRVAPEKDVIECVGKKHPQIRHKVQVLSSVLNGIYNRANNLNVEYMQEMSKREVRRHLRELGLPPFGEALVAMTCFGVHAIPVDEALFEVLLMNELVHESSDVSDTQAFLERVIAQKDGLNAHEFFRDYVVKNAKALEKKRQEDAERKAAEEEAKRQAEREAQEQAAAEAARKELLEAEKEAKKAKKEAEKLAKAQAKKPTKKKASKSTTKKAAKKSRKATAKKTPKKAPAKKAAQKPTTASKKKTAKKKKSKKAKK